MRTAAARTTTTEGPTWVLDPPAGPRFDGLADWYAAEVRRLPLTTTAAGALLPGYQARGWHSHGPGFNAASGPGRRPPPAPGRPDRGVPRAGLTLRRIEEPGEDNYPFLL